MLTLKSNREIALMKEAGRIVELAHIAVRNAAKPGVTTLELDITLNKVASGKQTYQITKFSSAELVHK